MSRTRAYQGGSLVAEGFPVSETSDHLRRDGTVVWVDYQSPSADDLAEASRELGLHELAVEDALHAGQRPKIDRYASHLFVVLYDVRLNDETAELVTSEVKAFVTEHALITIHDDRFDVGTVVQRWDESADLAGHGVSYLLWGLLDTIVDRHFAAVDSLDGQIDGLEDTLFDERPRPIDVQKRSFQLRKSLVKLRRIVLPMRELVNTLLRGELHDLTPEMDPYFQDVYDHVLRVSEQTEALRDLVATILETNLSIQGNQMNLVMKKVTSWAAIIAVPTAITGFFGQNVAFPGFGTVWGMVVSSALIVAISILLYQAFRKRDWL